MGRSRFWLAGMAAAVVASTPLATGPAHAQLGSLLLGKPGTKSRGDGVFEVTARGNNARERRSSVEMALLKAARLAAKQSGSHFAVLREKSGTWRMGGRAIGDETTLRIKVLTGADSISDDQGGAARVFAVADFGLVD